MSQCKNTASVKRIARFRVNGNELTYKQHFNVTDGQGRFETTL